MTSIYHHDPAFLKAVETLIQTIQFDVNGTAGKGGNGGLTSDKAIRQSGELNIMMDRIKKLEAAAPPVDSLQDRVQPWMIACFGPEISADRLERADRLLEEVFELLQSGDYPRERIRALEEYTFSRERCEPAQEVGGVMITLAAYCLAHEMDMHHAGEVELSRIWTKVEKIRAKQAAKPTGSALPVVASSASDDDAEKFESADFYWRTMDPDDSGEYPQDAINRAGLGLYCVAEIASSFTGPKRFGFIAPVLDLDSDEEEFLHFATQPEALKEAEARRVAIDLREAERECCVACDVPLEVGDLVYWCSSDDSGHLHADCCGPDRESYVHPDGSPLRDDEPIPAPFAWKPHGSAPDVESEGQPND